MWNAEREKFEIILFFFQFSFPMKVTAGGVVVRGQNKVSRNNMFHILGSVRTCISRFGRCSTHCFGWMPCVGADFLCSITISNETDRTHSKWMEFCVHVFWWMRSLRLSIQMDSYYVWNNGHEQTSVSFGYFCVAVLIFKKCSNVRARARVCQLT